MTRFFCTGGFRRPAFLTLPGLFGYNVAEVITMASPSPLMFVTFAFSALSAGLLLACPGLYFARRDTPPAGLAAHALRFSKGACILCLLACAAFFATAFMLYMGAKNYWYYW